MKKFAALMIKILALYFAVTAVSSLSTIIQTMSIMHTMENMGGGFSPTIYLMPFIFKVVICVLLWIFSNKIAHFMVDDVEWQAENSTIDYNKLLTIAIKVTGVLLVVMSLDDGLFGLVSLSSTPMNMLDFNAKFVLLVKTFYPFFQMIIGIVLVTSKRLHQMIAFKGE